MNSVLVVIGQSGSGKTTYVKKHFINEKPIISNDYAIPVTVSGQNLLIGSYNIGKRCEGTDTLSYSAIHAIEETIFMTHHRFNVIAEGDRVNNTAFFEYIRKYSIPYKIILFKCSIDKSMQRLRANGSRISEQFVRATATKSNNNYMKYATIESEVHYT